MGAGRAPVTCRLTLTTRVAETELLRKEFGGTEAAPRHGAAVLQHDLPSCPSNSTLMSEILLEILPGILRQVQEAVQQRVRVVVL